MCLMLDHLLWPASLTWLRLREVTPSQDDLAVTQHRSEADISLSLQWEFGKLKIKVQKCKIMSKFHIVFGKITPEAELDIFFFEVAQWKTIRDGENYPGGQLICLPPRTWM